MQAWISEIRTRKRITQKTVARIVGISRAHYTNIESGKRRPSPEIAKKIAEFLDFDWTRFFSDKPVKKPPAPALLTGESRQVHMAGWVETEEII